MRLAIYAILLMFSPLLLRAQKQTAAPLAPQEKIYFNKPAALQAAGVKWVNAIYKDSRGLTWFATSSGLFRFDGTNVLYTKHRVDDSLSLPSSETISIAEDKDGNMWVGTAKGGVMMNPNTFTCTRIRDDKGFWPGYKVNFMTDAQGNVWSYNDVGLYQYNKDKNNFRQVWSVMSGNNSNEHVISSLASYNAGELVAGTLGDVVFINKKDFSYRRVKLLPGKVIDVSRIYVDANGELWVATWGFGLFHYNKATQQFTQFAWQQGLTANMLTVIKDVASVQVNNRTFLYIATPGGLLKEPLQKDGFTPVQGSQAVYTHQPDTDGSLPYNEVNTLFIDENNTLWVGAGGGDIGVANVTLSESLLYTLPVKHEGNVQAIDNLPAGNKKYYAVCSWHGNTGLLLLDENLNEVKAFNRLPADADHDGVNVSSAGVDGMNRLWVSSWKGITVMDNNLNVVRVLDHRTKGTDTLYKEKNNYLLISNDTVWIASYKRGIDLFTTGFKRLKHYSFGDDNGLREELIWKFYRGRTGKIWLLGNAYLYSYDAARDRFVPYFFSRDSAGYSPSDMVEKKDGSLLIASAVGLIQLNPNTGNYNYIHSPLLDKDDYVNAVCLDEDDNAWYITDEHLVHYNFSNNIFTIYGKQDGLDITDGLYMLRYVGHNKLLLGQHDKITVFTASQSVQKSRVPGLLITGITVNDSLLNNTRPNNKLVLNYNQNKINIAFACVNYNRPEQNIYAYRLKNTGAAWAYTRQGSVSYANLSPGHYTFEVKAANYARVWSNVAAFEVVIKPPFWQTLWFATLMLCLAVSGTYMVFRWRLDNVRKEEKIKTALNQKMAQLEMKALRAQMNPHFVFNSLSSIQESIVTGKTEAASKYLSKFSKLIRLILENSGRQFIPVKTEIDLLTLYLELESFRFENFTYTLSIAPQIDVHFTTIPGMVIQPFIENAIKHGLAKKKDNKHVKIDIDKQGGQLVAIVEDNGVGRVNAAAMKQAEKADHHSMGINITEERLQLLGAQPGGPAATITDLYDEDGNAAGTYVKIILPVEN